jgi:hypothetical protein
MKGLEHNLAVYTSPTLRTELSNPSSRPQESHLNGYDNQRCRQRMELNCCASIVFQNDNVPST